MQLSILPAPSLGLPAPQPTQLAWSAELAAHIAQRILASSTQSLPFEDFMDAALYAPRGGYYMGGGQLSGTLIGELGDFTTAPEISPFFASALARQVAQVLSACPNGEIIEFGAGAGTLARGLLQALEAQHGLRPRYNILELSASLRDQQVKALGEFSDRTVWLDKLPDRFEGVALGNEVLDAMPVDIFERVDSGFARLHVVLAQRDVDTYEFAFKPSQTEMDATLVERFPDCALGHRIEVDRYAQAFVRSAASWLRNGVAFFIDYGFPEAELMHAERTGGTLMCHYKHRAHANPLILPGLQDITAHVNFTSVAISAQDAGLHVLGYTNQAWFLMNNGILDELPKDGVDKPTPESIRASKGLQTLLAEHEMGELFKVIAIGTEDMLALELNGFKTGDRTHRL